MSDSIKKRLGKMEIPILTADSFADYLYASTNHSPRDRSRPYDGQPHTDSGERGKTVVQDLTYRDVADCFVIAFVACTHGIDRSESADLSYNDVYEDGDEIDPLAIMQNMLCEMEKRQSIYPNVPSLQSEPTESANG